MRDNMPLVNAKCTNCGANLKVDNTKGAAICEYCGSAYIVEKAINNYNITNNNTIHADIVNIYETTKNSVQPSSYDYEKRFIDIVEDFILYISDSTDFGVHFLMLDSLKNDVISNKGFLNSKAENLYKQILSKISSGILTISQDDVNCLLNNSYPYKNEYLENLVAQGIETALLTKNKLNQYNCFQYVNSEYDFRKEYPNLKFTGSFISAHTLIRYLFNSSCIMEFRDCIVIYASKNSYLSEYDFKKSIELYLIPYIGGAKDLVEYRDIRVWDGSKSTALRISKTTLSKFCDEVINGFVLSRHNRKICSFCGGEFKGLLKKTCSQCGKPKDY